MLNTIHATLKKQQIRVTVYFLYSVKKQNNRFKVPVKKIL